MRISDWSSDVCSSDLGCELAGARIGIGLLPHHRLPARPAAAHAEGARRLPAARDLRRALPRGRAPAGPAGTGLPAAGVARTRPPRTVKGPPCQDGKSVVEVKMVSVRVDLGGRR